MDSLAQIVKDTLSWYVAGGSDHKMYGLTDDNEQVFAVIAVGFPVPCYAGCDGADCG